MKLTCAICNTELNLENGVILKKRFECHDCIYIEIVGREYPIIGNGMVLSKEEVNKLKVGEEYEYMEEPT